MVFVPNLNFGNNRAIDVEYNSKKYVLQISSKSYINNTYKINDLIPVYYSKKFDYLLLKSKNNNFSYYFSIAFFLFPLYCLIKFVGFIKRKYTPWAASSQGVTSESPPDFDTLPFKITVPDFQALLNVHQAS